MTIEIGDGISLLSGAMMNYNDPEASDVTIDDIATALSNVCRFSGHLPRFYSVAQHAVNVSLLVPEDQAYDALMHDMAEAFTNDLPTPLKQALPVFKELEVRIEAAMAKKFGFTYPLSPEVKLADLKMLKVEKELIKQTPDHWACLDGVEVSQAELDKLFLQPMLPNVAREFFLSRYRFLTNPEAEAEKPVLSIADMIRERIARGDKPFFAWGEYDEKSKRAWLQAGHC